MFAPDMQAVCVSEMISHELHMFVYYLDRLVTVLTVHAEHDAGWLQA